MYIKEFLNSYSNKKIKLYVDMDGVIADYNVGEACEYDKKRPLYDSIKKLEEVSKMPNVEMFVLSTEIQVIHYLKVKLRLIRQ